MTLKLKKNTKQDTSAHAHMPHFISLSDYETILFFSYDIMQI